MVELDANGRTSWNLRFVDSFGFLQAPNEFFFSDLSSSDFDLLAALSKAFVHIDFPLSI